MDKISTAQQEYASVSLRDWKKKQTEAQVGAPFDEVQIDKIQEMCVDILLTNTALVAISSLIQFWTAGRNHLDCTPIRFASTAKLGSSRPGTMQTTNGEQC